MILYLHTKANITCKFIYTIVLIKFQTNERQIILTTIFLKIKYCKCCITIELNYVRESVLLKVIKVNNAWFAMIQINAWFKFQDSVCNGCRDFIMLSVNINDIVIITIKNVNHCCIIHNISKSEAINLVEHSVICKYIKILF